jgi:hypothetical protein
MLETQRSVRKENEIMKERDRKLNLEVQLREEERNIIVAKTTAQRKVNMTHLWFNLDQLYVANT